MQKSSIGSYYIDVESFTGYRTVDHPLKSEGSNCEMHILNVVTYSKGKVFMIENAVNNHSWCCFTVSGCIHSSVSINLLPYCTNGCSSNDRNPVSYCAVIVYIIDICIVYCRTEFFCKLIIFAIEPFANIFGAHLLLMSLYVTKAEPRSQIFYYVLKRKYCPLVKIPFCSSAVTLYFIDICIV